MKFYFHPKADKELLDLDKDSQETIRHFIEEFKDEGMSYENFGRLTDESADIDCFRLKIKQKEPLKMNHRVIISVLGQQFVAYGVKHRNNVYAEDYIEEIKERMY